VLPSEFVPRAERTGQVLKLGRWVLGEACRQAAGWHRVRADQQPLEVTVNVSSTQLRAPDLVDEVREAIGAAGLDPPALLLEITETALVRDTDGSFRALGRLQSLGIRIALRDRVLLPALPGAVPGRHDEDREGARRRRRGAGARAEDGARDDAAGRGVRPAGDRRGIERAEQVAASIELGCELGQANHFSPPLPPEQVERLLSA
jgi:EAL domain-containing protein (putative c-di-GMP-specific phosphodiesterase class I)